MKPKQLFTLSMALLISAGLTCTGFANPLKFKYTTEIPPSVMTLDTLKTERGTLRFVDGVPTEKTAQMVWQRQTQPRCLQVRRRPR